VTPLPTILIIANRTLGGDALRHLLEDRLAAGPVHVHVVVPATRQQGLMERAIDAYAGEPDPGELADERAVAQARLGRELARLRALGAEAEGDVGDADPVQAALDASDGRHFDEVVLSTLPAGASQWLNMDLPSRLERALDRPVTHVFGPPAADG
jgi:hypothetical protein